MYDVFPELIQNQTNICWGKGELLRTVAERERGPSII